MKLDFFFLLHHFILHTQVPLDSERKICKTTQRQQYKDIAVCCVWRKGLSQLTDKVLLKTQIQGRNIASHKHLTWTPYWRLKWFLWVTLEASLFLLSYNCKTNVLELHHESKLFDAYCIHMKLVRWHILLVVQFATLVLNILITEMICVYMIQIYSLVFFLLDTPRDQSLDYLSP